MTDDKNPTTPAAGTTRPAGEGISDEQAVEEVVQQTDPDLKAEAVFEREADGAASDTPADKLTADEVDQ